MAGMMTGALPYKEASLIGYNVSFELSEILVMTFWGSFPLRKVYQHISENEREGESNDNRIEAILS